MTRKKIVENIKRGETCESCFWASGDGLCYKGFWFFNKIQGKTAFMGRRKIARKAEETCKRHFKCCGSMNFIGNPEMIKEAKELFEAEEKKPQ